MMIPGRKQASVARSTRSELGARSFFLVQGPAARSKADLGSEILPARGILALPGAHPAFDRAAGPAHKMS